MPKWKKPKPILVLDQSKLDNTVDQILQYNTERIQDTINALGYQIFTPKQPILQRTLALKVVDSLVKSEPLIATTHCQAIMEDLRNLVSNNKTPGALRESARTTLHFWDTQIANTDVEPKLESARKLAHELTHASSKLEADLIFAKAESLYELLKLDGTKAVDKDEMELFTRITEVVDLLNLSCETYKRKYCEKISSESPAQSQTPLSPPEYRGKLKKSLDGSKQFPPNETENSEPRKSKKRPAKRVSKQQEDFLEVFDEPNFDIWPIVNQQESTEQPFWSRQQNFVAQWAHQNPLQQITSPKLPSQRDNQPADHITMENPARDNPLASRPDNFVFTDIKLPSNRRSVSELNFPKSYPTETLDERHLPRETTCGDTSANLKYTGCQESHSTKALRFRVESLQKELTAAKEMWLKESQRASGLYEQNTSRGEQITVLQRKLEESSAKCHQYELRITQLESLCHQKPVKAMAKSNQKFAPSEVLVLKLEGVLMCESGVMEIGGRLTLDGTRGVLRLFYGNLSAGSLDCISVELVDKVPNLEISLLPVSSTIRHREQISQSVVVQCFGVYRGVPRLTMKFLLSDATPTFVNFALPLPVTRFVAPLEVDAAEFTEMWNTQELWINEEILKLANKFGSSLGCLVEKLELGNSMKMVLGVVDNIRKCLVYAGRFPCPGDPVIPLNTVLARIEMNDSDEIKISIRSENCDLVGAVSQAYNLVFARS